MRGISIILAAATASLILSACVSGGRPERMVPEAARMPSFTSESAMLGSIAVTEVTGGEETSGLDHSNVSNKELKDALQAALAKEGLLSTNGSSAPLRLKASLIDLSHPPGMGGFTLTISSTIRYQLINANSNERVSDELVTTSFSAGVKDELLGTERLRVANEGSVRANIAEFLSRLATTNVGGAS